MHIFQRYAGILILVLIIGGIQFGYGFLPTTKAAPAALPQTQPCTNPDWYQVEIPGPEREGERTLFFGNAVLSPNDVWAVGATYTVASGVTDQNSLRILIMHWDGSHWSRMPNPLPGAIASLYDVAAVSANDIWAIGTITSGGVNQSSSLVLHWDGSRWSNVPAPNPGSWSNRPQAIAAISTSDIWVGGDYWNTSRTSDPFAMHWDGNRWNLTSVPETTYQRGPSGQTDSYIIHSFTSVEAFSPTDVWAIGYNQPRYVMEAVLTAHWDGQRWTQVPAPNPSVRTDGGLSSFQALYDSSASGPNDIWAVGRWAGRFESSGTPVYSTFVEHWNGTSWSHVPSPDVGISPSIAAIAPNDAWAAHRSIMHWNGNVWSSITTPHVTVSNYFIGTIAAISTNNIWALGSYRDVGEVSKPLALHYTCQAPPSPTPATTMAPSVTVTSVAVPTVEVPGTGSHTFPETGKTTRGLFLDYWKERGGLAQQGFPISGEFIEVSDLNKKSYTVQYFERAVFEYHPENKPPHNVLLSQLGTFAYKWKYGTAGATGQRPNNSAGSVLFSETGKRVGGKFLDYWTSHGGLAQQGLPISDEFTEKSPIDGKEYTVQYFERAVFEHHPENAAPNDVLLSLLGVLQHRDKYGVRP